MKGTSDFFSSLSRFLASCSHNFILPPKMSTAGDIFLLDILSSRISEMRLLSVNTRTTNTKFIFNSYSFLSVYFVLSGV